MGTLIAGNREKCAEPDTAGQPKLTERKDSPDLQSLSVKRR